MASPLAAALAHLAAALDAWDASPGLHGSIEPDIATAALSCAARLHQVARTAANDAGGAGSCTHECNPSRKRPGGETVPVCGNAGVFPSLNTNMNVQVLAAQDEHVPSSPRRRVSLHRGAPEDRCMNGFGGEINCTNTVNDKNVNDSGSISEECFNESASKPRLSSSSDISLPLARLNLTDSFSFSQSQQQQQQQLQISFEESNTFASIETVADIASVKRRRPQARALTPLPRELWVAVFSLLSPASLVQAALVCRRFRDFAHAVTASITLHDADASLFTTGFIASNYPRITDVRVDSVRTPLRGLLAPLSRTLKVLRIWKDDPELTENTNVDVFGLYALTMLEDVEWKSSVAIDWRRFSCLRRLKLHISGRTACPLPQSLEELILHGAEVDDNLFRVLVGQVQRSLSKLELIAASITAAVFFHLPQRLLCLRLHSCLNLHEEVQILPRTLRELSLWRVPIPRIASPLPALEVLRIHGSAMGPGAVSAVIASGVARARTTSLLASHPRIEGVFWNNRLRVFDWESASGALFVDTAAICSLQPSDCAHLADVLRRCERLTNIAAPVSILTSLFAHESMTGLGLFANLDRVRCSGSWPDVRALISVLPPNVGRFASQAVYSSRGSGREVLAPQHQAFGVFPPGLKSLKLALYRDIDQIMHFPANLVRLEVSSCSLNDHSLVAVRLLHVLRVVALTGCNAVTDQGLKHFSLLQLWSLKLGWLPQITAEGIARATQRSSLETLEVNACALVDKLTLLNLMACKSVVPQIQEVARLPNLQSS